MKYQNNSKFVKQLDKLKQKLRSLDDDIVVLKESSIELLHVHGIDDKQSCIPVPGFQCEYVIIYKVKKFACKSLKGKGVRSGVRVIYAYFPSSDTIEFLQIYFKKRSDTDMNYDHIKKFVSQYL